MEKPNDLRSSTPFDPIVASADERGGAFLQSVRSGPTPLVASVAWRTCRGLVRDENQDTFIVGPAPGFSGGILLAVFDGVGGQPGGRLASQTAADTFEKDRSAFLPSSPHSTFDAWLRSTMVRANDAVRRCGRKTQMPNMSTTATVLVAKNDRLFIGHTGDARAYRMRGGKLKLLTRDHTMVEALVSAGKTPEEAHASGWGGTILSALGIDDDTLTIDIVEASIEPGDALLLSTDGLHGVVPDYRIEQILAWNEDPSETARQLMGEAYNRRSDDNITIIVAKITKITKITKVTKDVP